MHDVLIIGAGPIGLAAAIEAKRRGLTALVIEKGALVNSFIGYPTQLEFFSTPELLEIGGHPFPTLGYKPTREEAIEYYRKVAETEELQVHLYERANRVDGQAGAFTVHTDSSAYGARAVVLATGFFDVPNLLDVPGEELDKVTHYFKEPYPYSGQDVLVVGAKNSAAKAALSCYRHGARVTLAVRDSALSDSVKYWIKPDLENRITEGKIDVYYDTTVSRITAGSVMLETPEGPVEVKNDWVLAMTGYRPDYELFEAMGIACRDDAARTPVYDAQTFETNREGVYLAGTVCGGLNTSRWFIENGREHAKHVMDHVAATHAISAGATAS